MGINVVLDIVACFKKRVGFSLTCYSFVCDADG